MHFDVHVAADGFAVRQPWLVAWAADAPVLWVAQGRMGQHQGPLPWIESVRRVDLSDPRAVRTQWAVGVGPEGFLPPAIAEAIAGSLQVPAAGVDPLPAATVEVARVEGTIELLRRVQVTDAEGRPLAGRSVRFVVELPVPAGSVMRWGGAAAGSATEPANRGLEPARAISGVDGTAVALVSLSELALQRGAVIYALVERGGKPRVTSERGAQPRPTPARLPPVRLSADEVRAAVAREAAGSREVRGQLVGADGRPLADVLVTCTRQQNAGVVEFVRAVRTDALGRFALGGLGELPIRVVARVADRTLHAAGPGVTPAGEGGASVRFAVVEQEGRAGAQLVRQQ